MSDISLNHENARVSDNSPVRPDRVMAPFDIETGRRDNAGEEKKEDGMEDEGGSRVGGDPQEREAGSCARSVGTPSGLGHLGGPRLV